jgi:regulatory protein
MPYGSLSKGRKETAKPRAVTAQWLKNVAQFYLAQRIATERQVTDILMRKAKRRAGIPPDAAMVTLIGETVAVLKRANLLNDAAYAQARAATFKRKGLSAGTARMKLAGKGVSRNTAAGAVAEADFDEIEQIRIAARKLRIGPWSRDGLPVTDKDIARLSRRGFAIAAIRRALSESEPD